MNPRNQRWLPQPDDEQAKDGAHNERCSHAAFPAEREREGERGNRQRGDVKRGPFGTRASEGALLRFSDVAEQRVDREPDSQVEDHPDHRRGNGGESRCEGLVAAELFDTVATAWGVRAN